MISATAGLNDHHVQIDMTKEAHHRGLGHMQIPDVSSFKNDYLGWSIFNLFCCCFLCGVPALVNSVRTRDMNMIGHFKMAAKHSRQSKRWNLIAAVCGTVFFSILSVAYYVTLRHMI